MNRKAYISTKQGAGKLALRVVAAMAIAALAGICVPRAAAQNNGSIGGQILDITGKPWPDIGIQAVSDQGAKQEGKTDPNGKYAVRNLRAGVYTVSIILPAPNKPYEVQCRVQGGEETKVDVNFKEIVAKQGAEAQEQVKKQEEEKQKFQSMKAHFDVAVVLLDKVKQEKADLAKAPPDQRDPLKQALADDAGKAVTELEAAKGAASEKDPNLNLILARLGDAYEAAGRSDDAISAYQQAIAQKPTAAYYNNLGGVLGRAGKIQEAMAAYQKSAELDPTNAAQAYRNGGITLYNVGKLKEAVEPLKKATDLDPKNAQAWYLLGASLVGSIDSTKDCKVTADKMDCKIPDGTLEAYQKALELDPNGLYGVQAKQGLEGLAAMSSGIQTKIGSKKKKP
jgi:tetratricopeptide (TPR) repeat protein